jgi:transcription elongation factor GreA
MPKDTILTPQGLEDLKTELEDLTTNRRREVAERIKEAREYGDISENSEYDDAKNEQAMLESRIALLEERIRSAQVVDAKALSTDQVQVGMTVTFTDVGTGKENAYTLVGAAEANSAERKLSNESPVGRALLGRRAGETVSVTLPNGSQRELKVDKIEIAG